MDDLENNPDTGPSEEVSELGAPLGLQPSAETSLQVARIPQDAWPDSPSRLSDEEAASNRRSFRHNLFLLLSLTLAAFILTAWILVRGDLPFGIFSTGPQEVARAQLRALDRGELRPAYDMFSPRYRQQVSFDLWHELITTHWRMFHAEVLRVGAPARSGPRTTLEMYVRGADDKTYRARFTLIRLEGRWWIDDVHWAEEGGDQDVSRT